MLLPSHWLKNPNLCFFLRALGAELSLRAALLVHTHVDHSLGHGFSLPGRSTSVQSSVGRFSLTGGCSCPLLIDGPASCGCKPGTKQCYLKNSLELSLKYVNKFRSLRLTERPGELIITDPPLLSIHCVVRNYK